LAHLKDSLNIHYLERPSISGQPKVYLSPPEEAVALEDDIMYGGKRLKYLCCVSLLNALLPSHTMAAIQDIEQMMAAFGQGLDLTRTQITMSMLLLSRFYELIPR
jgi:hypothetical protein